MNSICIEEIKYWLLWTVNSRMKQTCFNFYSKIHYLYVWKLKVKHLLCHRNTGNHIIQSRNILVIGQSISSWFWGSGYKYYQTQVIRRMCSTPSKSIIFHELNSLLQKFTECNYTNGMATIKSDDMTKKLKLRGNG